MAKDNLQLRNKTFLDFSPSTEIVSEVLGGYSRASFLEAVKHTPALRWNTYLRFADMLSDETLASEIRALAVSELRSLRDE